MILWKKLLLKTSGCCSVGYRETHLGDRASPGTILGWECLVVSGQNILRPLGHTTDDVSHKRAGSLGILMFHSRLTLNLGLQLASPELHGLTQSP